MKLSKRNWLVRLYLFNYNFTLRDCDYPYTDLCHLMRVILIWLPFKFVAGAVLLSALVGGVLICVALTLLSFYFVKESWGFPDTQIGTSWQLRNFHRRLIDASDTFVKYTVENVHIAHYSKYINPIFFSQNPLPNLSWQWKTVSIFGDIPRTHHPLFYRQPHRFAGSDCTNRFWNNAPSEANSFNNCYPLPIVLQLERQINIGISMIENWRLWRQVQRELFNSIKFLRFNEDIWPFYIERKIGYIYAFVSSLGTVFSSTSSFVSDSYGKKSYYCYPNLPITDSNQTVGKSSDSFLYFYLSLIVLSLIFPFLSLRCFLARKFLSGIFFFFLGYALWVTGFSGFLWGDWGALWRFKACRWFGWFAYPA